MTSIFDRLEDERERLGHGIVQRAEAAEHVIASRLRQHGYHGGHEPAQAAPQEDPMSVETRFDALKAEVEDVFVKYAPDAAKDAETAAAVASSPPAQAALSAVHLRAFPDFLDAVAAVFTKADAIVAQAQEAQAKAEAALAAATQPASGGAETAGDGAGAPDPQPQTGVAV